MNPRIKIDPNDIYHIIPWVGAADIFDAVKLRRLANATSDKDFVELIQEDVVAEGLRTPSPNLGKAKTAMTFLLTVTDPSLGEEIRSGWPPWARRYSVFSWICFWNSMLVPFQFRDQLEARHVVELIWQALFPEEDYRVLDFNRYYLFRDIIGTEFPVAKDCNRRTNGF